MRAWTSGAIPMPVSFTSRRTVARRSSWTSASRRTTTSPCWVNLMALPTTFVTSWRSRDGSAHTSSGSSSAIDSASSMPLRWARSASSSIASSTSALRSHSTSSISSLPTSHFEKSRMSLMTPSSASAERYTV
jgi:hypothetical protein